MAIAEALRPTDLIVQLVYQFGEPTEREAARARELDVEVVTAPGGRSASPAVTVVDLPDPNDVPIRSDGSRSVVFDDRHLFRGAASIIVQPSRRAWTGPGSAERVLAGYEYVPLAERFRKLRGGPTAPEANEPPIVLVCFGGSDPADVTGRVARGLADGPWRLDIVVGPSYAGTIDRQSADVRRDPADLAAVMATSDVVVLGGGTMKFEAACLGRPMVLAAAADDQIPVGEEFGRTGAAVWLGDGRSIDRALIRSAVSKLLEDATARASVATRAKALVDGRGAERIAAAIVELSRSAR